jgi:NAD(P)-dependent dehydrogenase (short-subunit alcohol dehydrogenase family)
MMKKLTGRVAVITGGSSGIGLAAAHLFKAEGASVVIAGRDAGKLAAAAQELGEIHTVQADVSTLDGIAHLLEEVSAVHGRVDVLFANAGISDAPEVFDTTEEDYERLINANVKSIFFLFTKAFSLLSEGASVIFTSSAAHSMGRPGDPLYAATKAAVRSLGRTFAMQEAVLEKKIRVNVVSPGAVATPLTRQDTPEMQTAIDDYIRGNVPMARWGTAREIATTVLFLASDDAAYMTGTDLAVDGGWSQL